jgi:ammonia channel protein AmtB
LLPGNLPSSAFRHPGVTVLATTGFAFARTFVILKVINAVVGLRVEAEEERRGLDLSQHEERAYAE